MKKTVAIVGASGDRSKFGNKAVRAYLAEGWEVYPVNPGGGTIEGLRVYTRLLEVPGRLDRLALYVPAVVGVQLLPQIAAAAPAEFYVNPGAESPELVAQATALGLEPILSCAIVALGVEPASIPD